MIIATIAALWIMAIAIIITFIYAASVVSGRRQSGE